MATGSGTEIAYLHCVFVLLLEVWPHCTFHRFCNVGHVCRGLIG